jgi:hypothetical protein
MRLGEQNRHLRTSVPVAAERIMGKAEQYRRYAAECVRLARQSQHPHEKDALLIMAAAWRRLAEHAERAGEAGPGRGPE